MIDWGNFIREQISAFSENEKLIGEGKIVEIDESLMRERRKYSRGRLLIGDLVDGNPDHNSRRQNNGDRVQGPWVFGLIEKDSRKAKMFYVEDRSRATLLPIILANVDSNSIIWSDQWAAYATLRDHFFCHQTVNHSESFIDPETGANTQLIECFWGHAKLEILRRMKGSTIDLLQGHLDFFCFKYRYKHVSNFEEFMKRLNQ